MEIRVPGVVQEQALNFLEFVELRDQPVPDLVKEKKKKVKTQVKAVVMSIVGITIALFFWSVFILACFSDSCEKLGSMLAFMTMLATLVSVVAVVLNYRWYVDASDQYEEVSSLHEALKDDIEPVQGYAYLCYQLTERAKVAGVIKERVWALRRQWMSGFQDPAFADTTPHERQSFYERLLVKAERFLQAVQDELDSVAGLIECHAGKDGLPDFTIKEAITKLHVASKGDQLVGKRLQALLYMDPEELEERNNKAWFWEPGQVGMKRFDADLHNLLFIEYMDKWNEDLSEWDPSITKTAATF